jgi:uncharacterized protein (DUF305 family)
VSDEPVDEAPRPARSRRLPIVLAAVMAATLLVVAGAVGWLVRGDGPTSATPSAVDVGFARDMATHHVQAVTMAGFERDNTADPQLRILAFDIETGQEFQVGEMQGWLDAWGRSRESVHPMAWMGGHAAHDVRAGGLMPGMATPAQMTKLESLRGRALDRYFLQLMIHHHQGGVPMAQYAQSHAATEYVRTFAAQVAAAQSREIVQMEQLLRSLGGSPLPPPA